MCVSPSASSSSAALSRSSPPSELRLSGSSVPGHQRPSSQCARPLSHEPLPAQRSELALFSTTGVLLGFKCKNVIGFYFAIVSGVTGVPQEKNNTITVACHTSLPQVVYFRGKAASRRRPPQTSRPRRAECCLFGGMLLIRRERRDLVKSGSGVFYFYFRVASAPSWPSGENIV